MPALNNKVFPKDDAFIITIGDFSFDFFLSDSGSLGFTVEKKDDPDHCVDIFVDQDLKVKSV